MMLCVKALGKSRTLFTIAVVVILKEKSFVTSATITLVQTLNVSIAINTSSEIEEKI